MNDDPPLPPAVPSETVTIQTKPFKTVALEGSLYFIIGAIPPALLVLQGESSLTPRMLTMMTLSCLLAGANALKAFFSQSQSAK